MLTSNTISLRVLWESFVAEADAGYVLKTLVRIIAITALVQEYEPNFEMQPCGVSILEKYSVPEK